MLADQTLAWCQPILKMTKYLSLVHANVNDISQLKKESEYRSVFTDDIELVDKNVCFR
jgi:hypothetical protein